MRILSLFVVAAALVLSYRCTSLHADDTQSAVSRSGQEHVDEFRSAVRQLHGLTIEDLWNDHGLGATDSEQTEGQVASKLGYSPSEAQYFDQVEGAYSLSQAQIQAYEEHGYVILDSSRADSFLNAFYSIFKRDLPVYISVDAILDSLHLSFSRMLKELEEDYAFSAIDMVLRGMHEGLREMSSSDDVHLATALDDAEFWVCTARSLLAGQQVESTRGVDDAVRQALQLVESESIQDAKWFGKSRTEDFSQFTPRGHYAGDLRLERYFRTMMWVQRIGVNFTETPRQASVAYLLSKSLSQGGVYEQWEKLEGVVSMFMGPSDSMNPRAWTLLMETSGIDSAHDFYQSNAFSSFVVHARRLDAGSQQLNSEIMMSPGAVAGEFRALPPAFHVMGQRFAVDSYVFSNVVYDRVPKTPDGLKRAMPSPLDAMFVLGNSNALPLLRNELEKFQYQSNLAALDWLVSSYDEAFWSNSLYNDWLSCVRKLNVVDDERFPSVMRTDAWRRRILHAQLASWAQFRHDAALYKKATYVSGECDYPHGWVDPYPGFYQALGRFAKSARKRFHELELSTSFSEVDQYFDAIAYAAEMLEGIAQAELERKELTTSQSSFFKKWLFVEGSSAAVFSGTYPRMVFRAHRGGGWFGMMGSGEPFDPTIADVHTDPFKGEVLHVGVGHPNLMLLSIKTEAANRVYVGPVLSYYEFRTNDMQRLTDADWQQRIQAGNKTPRPVWTRDFIR